MNGWKKIGLVAFAILLTSGCGTTKLQEATEQLVLSSAVDRSIGMIDFRPLAGQTVYLNTNYLRNIKSPTFVNADYVTSAMRQQIMAAGCFLQDNEQDADIVIEARLGTLGADDHRVTYGIPENNGLSTAASLISQSSAPAIPEIALARRDAREGAAKVAAFAYDRVSRTPVWQSGISQSTSTSRNTWVLGVGPFQSGSIREGTHLAKGQNRSGRMHAGASPTETFDRPAVEHTAEVRYNQGWPVTGKARPSGAIAVSGQTVRPPKPSSLELETSTPLPMPTPPALQPSVPIAADENVAEESVADESGATDENSIWR